MHEFEQVKQLFSGIDPVCFIPEDDSDIECLTYPGNVSRDFPKIEFTLDEYLTVFVHPTTYLEKGDYDDATGFTKYTVKMKGAYVSSWLLGTPFL